MVGFVDFGHTHATPLTNKSDNELVKKRLPWTMKHTSWLIQEKENARNSWVAWARGAKYGQEMIQKQHLFYSTWRPQVIWWFPGKSHLVNATWGTWKVMIDLAERRANTFHLATRPQASGDWCQQRERTRWPSISLTLFSQERLKGEMFHPSAQMSSSCRVLFKSLSWHSAPSSEICNWITLWSRSQVRCSRHFRHRRKNQLHWHEANK